MPHVTVPATALLAPPSAARPHTARMAANRSNFRGSFKVLATTDFHQSRLAASLSEKPQGLLPLKLNIRQDGKWPHSEDPPVAVTAHYPAFAPSFPPNAD